MSKRRDTAQSDTGVRVRAPDATGAQRFGDMLPGHEYTLPADEARRLVECKGFTVIDSNIEE